jgi:hypothetical protein
VTHICVTSPRCDGFAGQVGGNAGDRVERIPVTEAILRKVAVAAASGNTRAQQNYLNLLIGAEADRRVATMELLKAAVDYKEHWHHVLAERARTGTTGPEPVPHPDDVLIDYEAGNIRIDGPVMEDQKDARDQLRVMWPKLERELMGINEQIESDPNNLSLQLGQHIGQLVAARFLAHTHETNS